MKTTTTMLGAAALALTLTACGQKDDFSGATPDVAGLTLEVQGGAPEGLASLATAPLAALATVPDDGDELATIRAEIRALNGELRRVMERVEEAVQAAGTPAVGDRMIYGPADRCVVAGATATDPCVAWANFVLGVKRERDNLFTWLLQARPVGSSNPADFKPVAAGWLARGAQPHRGVGRLALNLRNLHAVQPAYPGDGFLLAGFANGPVVKSVHYRLVEFTPDGTNPRTAAYVGMKNGAGIRRVRVAKTQDLLASPVGVAPSDELLLARAAWLPGVAGRTFSIVTNWKPLDHTVMPPVVDPMAPPRGDVPGTPWDANYYFGRACYAPASPGDPLTIKFKEWYLCARAQAPAACVSLQGGVGTVVTGTGTWAGNCALPAEPPELGDPGDAGESPMHEGDEPGMNGTGMQQPPAPPTGPDDVGAPPPGMPGMTPMM